ncbi:MAG: hypothetical protein ACRC9V_15985, partial [Aeromonas sp.]
GCQDGWITYQRWTSSLVDGPCAYWPAARHYAARYYTVRQDTARHYPFGTIPLGTIPFDTMLLTTAKLHQVHDYLAIDTADVIHTHEAKGPCSLPPAISLA